MSRHIGCIFDRDEAYHNELCSAATSLRHSACVPNIESLFRPWHNTVSIISDAKLTNVIDDARGCEKKSVTNFQTLRARCTSGAGTKSAYRDYFRPKQSVV